MSDIVSVLRKISQLDVSPQFDSYSKVVIHVDDDTTYEYGTDTGRTLEFDNPFGSQQMCQDVLNRLRGYQYQPYTADGTLLNPAAEIGDALNSSLVYGGIYTRDKTFGRLMKADVSAPQDEEINHEYQFESPEVREFKRETSDLWASLTITNAEISAEVERATAAEGNLSSQINQTADYIRASVVANQGGDRASFGWTLTASGFSLFSGNREVLKCDSGGLTVSGNIAGTSGTIGGFTISASALYTNNMDSMWSNQSTGVHLSSNGIKLGQNFTVDSGGNLTCNNATILGSLNVGGQYITAAQLGQGAFSAYSNGGNWSSAYTSACTSGGYCYGASTSWNHAKDESSGDYPSYFRAGSIRASTGFYSPNFYVNSGGQSGSLNLSDHKHSFTTIGGTVYMGTPVASSSANASFNIADTQVYQNGVSAAYNNGYYYGYLAGSALGSVQWPSSQYDFSKSYIQTIYSDRAYVKVVTGSGSQFGWLYLRQ